MLNFSPGWYVLYTRPKQEKSVVKQLQEKNINTFLPHVQKVTNEGLCKKISSVILFPSYTFIYVNTLKDFFTAGDIKGVVNYVRIGKKPAKVSEKTISEIKLVIKAADNYEICSERFDYQCQYLIESGPLQGLTCEIIDHKGSKKALIRVLLLERCVLIDLKNTDLRRVG